MANSYIRFIERVNVWVKRLLALFLAIMSVTIVIQVFFRFIHKSLPWSEELTRYLMVYIVFLGASVALFEGKHMMVEVLKLIIVKHFKRSYTLLIHLAICLFFCVVVYYGVQMILISNSQVSPALQIPIVGVYLSIPLGGSLIILNSIACVILTLQENKEVEAG